MADRAAQTLELLDRETGRLLATARRLGEDDLARPTLSQGWDAAHLLTHVARNADALLNLVRYAVDGTRREAYASEEDRAADIEAGARRPVHEIVEDVSASAAAFRAEAEALTGPAGEAEVRTRTGATVTGAQVISMRLLEVVFHHVDLDQGYSLADADPDWVQRTLRGGVRRWAAHQDAPDLLLLPEGTPPLTVGGSGAVTVAGTSAQLLLWVGRGIREGLQVTGGPLPTPPPWA